MSAWTDHVARWCNCQLCPLAKQRTNIVLARGQIPCDVLFVGEAPGASEDALGQPFCIKEDHRVLMSDLTWKPLGEIKAGDTIIAPDEHGENVGSGASGYQLRRWRLATVLAVRHSQQQCMRLVTGSGVITLTPDHKVLTTRAAGKTRKWLRADQLKVQSHRASCLAHILTPWVREDSYKAGWVGGFLDGEGNVPKQLTRRQKARLAFAQNRGPTCEMAKRLVRELGYECSSEGNPAVKNEKVRIGGGFNKIIELLGRTRPERLITNFVNWIAACSPKCYGVQPTKILDIDHRTRSPQSVVDITTTTQTFVCEGFIVHNCGPAGNLLDQIVERSIPAGVRVAMTNLVACYPAEAKARGDNEPEQAEIRACRPRLQEFIGIARPKLVVCVGTLAADWVGHDAYGKVCGATTIDIVHPAHILRMRLAQKDMAAQRCIVQVRSAVEDMLQSGQGEV